MCPGEDRTWHSDICGDLLPKPIKIRFSRNDILYTGTRPDEWALDYPNLNDHGKRSTCIDGWMDGWIDGLKQIYT
jgi:hypothetical protein